MLSLGELGEDPAVRQKPGLSMSLEPLQCPQINIPFVSVGKREGTL